MRRFLTIIAYLVGTYALIFIHLCILFLLPAPWSSLNVAMLAASLHITGWADHHRMLMLTVTVFAFALDSFGGTVFGLLVIGLPLTVFVMTRLYYRIFTNRSWYTAGMMAAAGVFVFRTIYLLLLFSFSLIGVTDPPQYQTLIDAFFSEMLITAVITAILGVIFSLFSSRFKNDNRVYWQT